MDFLRLPGLDPVYYRKIPMSEETLERLEEIAESVSTDERKVSPMQVAAQLLEDGVEQIEPE